MSNLFIHTITLFTREESGNSVTFTPHVLNNCFLTFRSKVVQAPEGVTIANIGKSIIPFASLSSIDRVPSDNTAPQYYGGQDIINQGDYIAFGSYSDIDVTSKTVSKLPQCFRVNSVIKNDFSSIPCYVLEGI